MPSESTKKVAVSVPAELFRAVEDAREATGQSRSGVVQEALRHWLRDRQHAELVREYEAGYRRHPEGDRDVEEALSAAVALFEEEDDW